MAYNNLNWINTWNKSKWLNWNYSAKLGEIKIIRRELREYDFYE